MLTLLRNSHTRQSLSSWHYTRCTVNFSTMRRSKLVQIANGMLSLSLREEPSCLQQQINKAAYNAETPEVKKVVLERRNALHADAIEEWKLTTEAIEGDDSSYP